MPSVAFCFGFYGNKPKKHKHKIKTGGKISKMTKTNKTLLCVLLAMVLAFALALTALTITAQTATAEGETAVKTLDFSKTKCDSKTSSYTSKTTATVDGFVWSIENFNNNNLGWTYIKCGSKNAASVASIATDAPISEVIEKVVLTIDNVTANNVNSIKLTVASDKDFTTDTQTVDIPAVAIGAQTFTVANPIENGYYKIEIDCKKSSNGIVQISKVEYFAPAAPACDHSADKLTKTEAKAATCTEAGNVEYYTCTCGKIFADSAATTELTETAIPALGHTFGEWVFNNVAHTATRECSVCHTIETKDNTAITIFVNGEKLLPDGTDLTIRKATIEMGSEVLEISTLSENGQIYQGEGFYATFVTSRADKFDHANYTVTVEGGTLVWDESSTDSATITVADNALEVNITVVYNCSHTTKTYTRIAGTETHKVVCTECGATLVESEACVAGEDWQSDGANHWHVCTLCHGETDKAAHSYADGTCVCGKVKPVEVNYTRVENVSELKDGDKIIIVSSGKTMGAVGSNNYSAVSVTSKDGVITMSPDVVYVEITIGVSGNYFTLHTAVGYLYAASSSSNQLKAQANVDDNATWQIVINNGTATITAQGDNTRNSLRYNSNSNIFSCYASGQTAVSIYKVAAPSCDHANATLVPEVPATTEAEGTKEHYTCADCGKLLVKNGETYTEVTSQDLVIAKLVIVEVTEEISVSQGDNKAKLDAEANKIYLANGGKLVVTYSITQNSGVNALLFTLNYNKTLFKVESVVANAELGEALVVTGDEVQTDVYKVLLEGLKDAYNEKYTGLLVTVTYVYVGNLATFEGADAAFGLDSMEAHKSNTDGTTAPVETKTVLSNVIYDVIKQASITVEKTSFVYNGKAITAIGKGEHDQIKVTADGEGAISYKWYTDGTYATEVGEGYEVKNAGKYYLKLIVATTAAFEGSELKVEITITPFDLKNAESEIVITANDKQVTGSALTWTVEELTINGGNLATARGYDSDENIFTATIAEHSLTNVGETQNVAVTLALNANYTYGGENSVAATVTLKVVAYANAWKTEPQNITKEFDNNKLTFAYAAEHGTPVYYLGGEVKTAEELANAIVNAGTYEVKIVVEVVGYSNLEKTITITINKLKIDASSMMFDYSEDGKIKWSNPTKAIGSTGAIDLPTAVKFTYTLVDGKTENYGEDAVLEYLAQAEGAYTLNVIPGDAVNYEGTSTTTKTVYTITFAEGTHDGDNVIEGVAAYATVYRFDGQNAPAAPAAPVLAGYRFDGWTNNDMFGVAVTASVTLTAQWVKTYVIAWNNDNGSALESKTVDAGTQIAYSFETAPTSVLGADGYYTYTFAGWKNGEEVRELGYTFTVNGDITVTATYTSTLAYVDVTYTLTYGNNTTATDTITKVAIDTAVSAIGLPELKAYTWFKNDGWECGENAFTAATANLANEKVITISATYVFAIGNGDVDGSGTVDPSDIVLYRKHIVGGYDITPVTDAWTTATAEGFDESKEYFLAQVANVDEDGSNTNDVRDVSTIRMALAGGYGYTVENGAVIKGSDATAQSAKVQYKQVLAPMGLFGKKFAL